MAYRRIKTQQLDRTLFEKIRLAVVAAGYLPDVTLVADEDAYEAAKAAIRATNKQIIEVMGVGAPEVKDDKTFCKIYIDQGSITPSKVLGGGGQTYQPYVDVAENKFRRVMLPISPKQCEYRITTVATTSEYERIMQDIIFEVLSSDMAYIHEWKLDNTGFSEENPILLMFNGRANTSAGEFVEKVYSYIFDAIWIDPVAIILEDIVPLTTVNYRIAAMLSHQLMEGVIVGNEKNVDNVTVVPE